MSDPGDNRVAVYIDFDNIVISRYDEVHGRSHYSRDRVRTFGKADSAGDAEIAARLKQAAVDIGAVIDFASSFGTLVLTRAYADWSQQVNADYRHQLVGRAVDLVQLFPAAAYGKNGADIRLAVDAVEDMFRLPDLTHVVIVAGDSDYIALAQRCKRLGRYVVGVGVAGSTSKSLGAACDEMVTYDALPGIVAAEAPVAAPAAGAGATSSDGTTTTGTATEGTAATAGTDAAPAGRSRRGGRGPKKDATVAAAAGEVEFDDATDDAPDDGVPDGPVEDPQAVATRLLERALRLSHEKDDDARWLHGSVVKNQMKRMDPSFSEKALGYRSFSDFVRSRKGIAELEETDSARLVRLAPTYLSSPFSVG